MANPPRRFRVDGRLDEPVLQIPPLPDEIVERLGFDPPLIGLCRSGADEDGLDS